MQTPEWYNPDDIEWVDLVDQMEVL
jgi:hypothetical protein